MVGEKTSKEITSEVVKKMIADLTTRTDIKEPVEFGWEYSDDTQQLDEGEGSQGPTANLAQIPECEWANLRVSKKSVFGDISWDFMEEGSPLYETRRTKVSWDSKLTEGITLIDRECEPLRKLLMACLYYYLPPNNFIGYCRSYNTVIPMFRGFVNVARVFYERSLFIDNHGNGSYLNASVLTEFDIVQCVEEQPTVSVKLATARALNFWQTLSDAGYLPVQYRLNHSSVTKDLVIKTTKERFEGASTFMPITLDTLSVVVPYCINLIERHSEEIFMDYDLLHPVFANKEYKERIGFKWNDVIAKLRDRNPGLWKMDDFCKGKGSLDDDSKLKLLKMIRHHPDWPTYRAKYFPIPRKHIAKASHVEILDIATLMGIDLMTVGDGTILYDLRKIRCAFMEIFTTFRYACQIIICLVTGMRMSELLHMKANKAWAVPGANDEYRLEFEVFKTSEASQGDTVVIPIPEIAYKAYKALERITEKARQFSTCDYLNVNITVNFGKRFSASVFHARLCEFWEDLGIEEAIHSHMFRKTLAMFAIYQDPRNITVIKHLFSHKSLAMTLAYVVKIPGLSEDIKLAIVEHNAELLAELLAAAKNEKIGGACGLRIKEQIKSGSLAARLNDEGRESIEQYVHSILEQGLRLLHRCPLSVICTNTHDSVVSISPELCNCEVTNCDYAVFTEDSLPALVDEIRFHEKWIKHSLVSEDQIRFSRRKINDCLERFAEIQGKEAAMADFPEYYGLVA